MGLFAMEGSLDFTLQSMGNHWYIIRGFIYLFNWVLTRVSQDMNYIKHTVYGGSVYGGWSRSKQTS